MASPERSQKVQDRRRAGICITHDDLAWEYYDGSISCMYCLVVERAPGDCKWAPMPTSWRRFP